MNNKREVAITTKSSFFHGVVQYFGDASVTIFDKTYGFVNISLDDIKFCTSIMESNKGKS